MENLKLGKCCACEREDETVRNAITLDKKTLEEKGGWGCFVCDLPAMGAVAVACDECLDKFAAGQIKLKFACLGYPGENRRIEIEKLTEVFQHDLSKHQEEDKQAQTLDWEQAFIYFGNVRKNYQDLAGTPGVNTSLALEHVFRPLAERYERGERTLELFFEMISVE